MVVLIWGGRRCSSYGSWRSGPVSGRKSKVMRILVFPELRTEFARTANKGASQMLCQRLCRPLQSFVQLTAESHLFHMLALRPSWRTSSSLTNARSVPFGLCTSTRIGRTANTRQLLRSTAAIDLPAEAHLSFSSVAILFPRAGRRSPSGVYG
jgi:hypothetical protein